MQFSARPSELYMEFSKSGISTGKPAPEEEFTLSGWAVEHGTVHEEQYHTLNAGDVTALPAAGKQSLAEAVSALLERYIADAGRVLVCGLGNRELTADRLGNTVCSRLSLCGPLPGGRTLYSFTPGVQAVTGIPTDRLVQMAARCVRAQRIIAVDALCARSALRLGTVVQLSDTGITPGSGTVPEDTSPADTEAYPPEISTRTMPCPVVTVGVPTVIRTTLPDGGDTRYLVTSGITDRIVDCWGTILSSAILRAMLTPP